MDVLVGPGPPCGHPDLTPDWRAEPMPDEPTGAPGPAPDPARVVQDALALPDAAARARALTGLLVDAREWVAFLSSERDDALRAMRADGASYSDVAMLLGVSKSRAQQICGRLERGAGGPRRAD